MDKNINFKNLVRQLLPLHKRQAIRLWWLCGLVSPLVELFTMFNKWRSDKRKTLNLNSQIKVMESYLSQKYGKTISIATFETGALRVSLKRDKKKSPVIVGLKNAVSPSKVSVPLKGARRKKFGDVNFIVKIPSGIDISMIASDIEKFKQAYSKYKIIQL